MFHKVKIKNKKKSQHNKQNFFHLYVGHFYLTTGATYTFIRIITLTIT